MLSKEASSTIFESLPGDWTLVYQAISEHSTHLANGKYK